MLQSLILILKTEDMEKLKLSINSPDAPRENQVNNFGHNQYEYFRFVGTLQTETANLETVAKNHIKEKTTYR